MTKHDWQIVGTDPDEIEDGFKHLSVNGWIDDANLCGDRISMVELQEVITSASKKYDEMYTKDSSKVEEACSKWERDVLRAIVRGLEKFVSSNGKLGLWFRKLLEEEN